MDKIIRIILLLSFSFMILLQLNACTGSKEHVSEKQTSGLIAEASPAFGKAPLEVVFKGSNPLKTAENYSFTWDFDDGQYSDEKDTTHTFISPGTYMVSLAMTDASGMVDTTWVTIIID